MRATLSPAFTGSKMRLMFDFMSQVGLQTAKTMREQFQAGSDNVIEFKAFTTKFTVDVIASCAFGIEVNSFENPKNDFHKFATETINLTNWKIILKFIGYLAFPALMRFLKIGFFGKKITEFFQVAITDTIKYREEHNIIRNDMIQLLLQAKKGQLSHSTKEEEKFVDGFATVEESQLGKMEVKQDWTYDDMAAQAFIFFFAGFEPVAGEPHC